MVGFNFEQFFSDIKQQLKACLIPPSGPDKFGAVSAVTINYNSTRLLVGYAKGPVSCQPTI